ncbi:ExeM/NucH family extracellular endonuclease [Agromyces neolithicus]
MKHVVQRATVTIAAGALLAVGLAAAPAAAAAAATPTELFISEYVEGSSFNKAVEIYNPTEASVDLSQYALRQYSNGNTTTSLNQVLNGTLAAGDTFVFAQATAAAAILAVADQTTGTGLFNGDDALILVKGETVVDSLGQVGFDPGSQWGTDLTSTADNTLRRLASVCVGDTNPNDVFDPAAEWVGFATDTFDGLGTHTCGETGPQPTVINEFSASTAGTDVEFVELLAEPGTDVSGARVLEIEGDAGASLGVVDEVVSFDALDSDGRALTWLSAGALENGTMSLLLVTGFDGALGDDLDADDDGVIDDIDGLTVVDSIAVHDGGAGDLAYGDTVLTVAYDGLAFAPGAASRIPDGVDTGSTADWVRNDFDKAGIPGNTGSLISGEAANTPGVRNSLTVVVVPLPPADCNASVVTIGSVQGTGPASPVVGASVQVEGVVTGDFQVGGFEGYYLQDAGDGDAATSDGIFVFAPTGLDVAPGDVVHIAGTVNEHFGMTEITATADATCEPGESELPAATEITLPAASPDVYEPLEGMRVTLPQSLSILEFFEYGRFGTITLGSERHMSPTAVAEPGQAANAVADANALDTITLDDGRSQQNPDPAIHPNGEVLTLDNLFRGGDLVTNATGVLDYRFDTWAVQPTEGADFEKANARDDNPAPEVGGTTKVSSFNVLNYFTTLGSRGANDAVEFERQEAKIVAALAEIDADIFGLIEIENSAQDVPLNTLVDALNDVVGAGTYDAIETGLLGTDVITTALIYKPAEVAPIGAHAVLDSSVDPDFDTEFNRPALAQTFTDLQAGGEVTVVVNHLKSKGSDCDDVGDPDTGDGSGNCNITRTKAATALAEWLAGDPTGQGAGNEIIMGDLNSYDKEAPIDALRAAGYTDLLFEHQGENAYSYVFDGALGYLDYALAGTALNERVTGAAAWHINSDEPSLIDYDMTFKQPAQDALYEPDEWRSSDHDPVIVGLDLDVIAPELIVSASDDVIFPPNNMWRTVTIDVDATDNVDSDVTVELEATAEGHKAQVEVVSNTEVRVLARQGAVYTLVYTATDDSGNSTTQTVTIEVIP